MLIYKVTCKVNGKVYVGQTSLTLEQRRYKHQKDAQREDRTTVKFHNALMKYGFDNFDWEILKECNTQEELDYYEKYYIKEFNCLDRELGYNLKEGGKIGGCYTEEAKQHIGEKTKERWENPEIAEKMLKGLQKGTETVKNKALENYIEKVCPNCNQTFKIKPYEKKQFCCNHCAREYLNKTGKLSKSLEKANEVNRIQFKNTQDNRFNLILEWLKNHINEVLNCKMNSLGFLNDLEEYIGVKDARTLAKVLDVSGRKNTVYKLRDLIKIYAEQWGNSLS